MENIINKIGKYFKNMIYATPYTRIILITFVFLLIYVRRMS